LINSKDRSIQKLSNDGKTFITKWGSEGSGDGQFDWVFDVKVDKNTKNPNVYVADTGNYRIQKFDKDGKFITKWGSKGSGDGQFEDLLGIGISNKGFLCACDLRIQKFTADGKFQATWGSAKPTIAQINQTIVGYRRQKLNRSFPLQR